MEIRDVKCRIGALVRSGKLDVIPDTEKDMFERIENIQLTLQDFEEFGGFIKFVGVTEEFKNVIRFFDVPAGETPAGFKHELVYDDDGSLKIDLKRDISYGKNGEIRPTNVLFSANSANPFEIATMKDFLANITTNPSIMFTQFINNPKANKTGEFKTIHDVLKEIAKIVGPGMDVSVEITRPFAPFEEILAEIKTYEEILSKYRLVVKVPHTGPLNKENIDDYINYKYPALTAGDSESYFYGHNLAYKLHELGYRINFTLMGDPHQSALALLAKPYFINAFVEKRTAQTRGLISLVKALDATGDPQFREQLHEYMLKNNLLASDATDIYKSENMARELLAYRHAFDKEGEDGLDSVRHSLRVLRQSNLPDTRLIICNTKTDRMYYDIDKMLTEKEFEDMKQKVVVTCDPQYFGRYTASSTIYAYQRDFLTSV